MTTINNIPTDVLEQELERRKALEASEPDRRFELRLALLDLDKSREMLWSNRTILEFFLDRYEEDFTELFHPGGQLHAHHLAAEFMLGTPMLDPEEYED